ncbi:MAG: DNA replication/repair protein RecF [Sarcina sp.]|jgi:DNA replication and repair protein RecF|uniref:DNA replication/repair protein RecF n=1 Tax=Sarcina sp. DSM 11001 TaxID=1798184 RepID=UPI000883E7E3|nr:DNA replication/repair protein RecF [Sarcina sp. DSM 11001]MBE5999839.1 DNA replication/repair protein RecF [Sarcina sp.]MEE1040818.1 DNA replication/repair protein RecF [Lachnospiraceae bacterium]MDO5485175.1 DNA replication/repair protein RecF [Sarcina sp.]SDL42811.1 DNA replication and repair protein RecF [Sarcina sp. DSM 11001]HAL59055.1 DNA replication/repair protein RecF [Sarcina sp.]
MYISSLELADFRNIASLHMEFSQGTNILYGENAQGKTNILESLYMLSTTKSHRGVRDRDMIRFGREESHIRSLIMKGGIDYRIDMHLRKNKSKGIAINGQRIKKASELIGILHIVFFSPEDLGIVKNGPAERRRFMDMELCQLDASYLHNLNQYNKTVENRNRLLRDIYMFPDLKETLDVWDAQLVNFGSKIIESRRRFILDLNGIVGEIHGKLSGGREHLSLLYEPNTAAEDLEERLRFSRERDIHMKTTSTGPHRDDFSFMDGEIDLRRYGSQGQQRTCALSLKLSEIDLVKKMIGHRPVLMMDDVLSELDSGRQNYLLNTIGGIQTFITCTGLDEFVNNRFRIDQVYRVENGMCTKKQEPDMTGLENDIAVRSE